LVVRALECADAVVRVAVVVPSRCGRATARNRLKRWMRESIRDLLRSRGPTRGWWLVVVARIGAATADHQQIGASLGDLLTRARVVPASGAQGERRR
jgi:ribonuclease P protein component